MKELKGQIIGALFVVLTVAALVAAGINFRHQCVYILHTAGLMWVARTAPAGHNYVVALDVKKGSSGESAGIHRWEVLDRIGNVKVTSSADIPALLFGKAWLRVDYHLYEQGVKQSPLTALSPT